MTEERHFCPNCKGNRQHALLWADETVVEGDFIWAISPGELPKKLIRGIDPSSGHEDYKHMFAARKCLGCNWISILHKYGPWQTFPREQWDRRFENDVPYEEMLPKEKEFAPPRYTLLVCDSDIEKRLKITDRLHEIFQVKPISERATFALIRGLIELILKDSFHRKTLEKSLDYIIKEGFVSPEGGDVLHKVRHLGNEALHDPQPGGQLKLDTAIEALFMFLDQFIKTKFLKENL